MISATAATAERPIVLRRSIGEAPGQQHSATSTWAGPRRQRKGERFSLASAPLRCCRPWEVPVTSIGGCAMVRVIAFALLVALLQPAPGWAQELSAPSPSAGTNETLKDAAIAALIIAASVATYKAMGRPCACPSDLMKNGRACGGRSAWSKAGGAKPLCFPSDVTPGMISAYRASKAIPALF
jgi:hypothetical protein